MPTLKVNVVEAINLFGADFDGKSDPYCLIKIGEGNQFSCIERTRKIKNTKNPTWKEVFTLNVNNPLTENLFIEVMNKEGRGKDNSLGYSSLPLHDLTRGIEKQVWLQLEGGSASSGSVLSTLVHLGKKKEKVNQGKVFLGVTALDFGLEPSTYPPGQMGQPGFEQQQQQQHQQPGFQQQQQQPGSEQPSLQQQAGLEQQQQQPSYQQSPQLQQPGLQSNIPQSGIQQQPSTQHVVEQHGSQLENLPSQQSPHSQQQYISPQSNQPSLQQQPSMQQQPMPQPGMRQPGMQYPPPSSGSPHEKSAYQ